MLATLLAAAEEWLLEPVERPVGEPPPDPPPRVVAAVIGLERGCGTTTVARALAAELAGRDPRGAALVAGPIAQARPALASPAAGRLARRLATLGGEELRVVGRLCIVGPDDPVVRTAAERALAPVVLDVPHGAPAESAVALADAAVLVASPGVEPALAAVVAASVARGGPEPALVVNRVLEPGPWAERPALLVGEGRLAAQLALAGREARGALGAAAARLADRVAEVVP